MDAGLRMDGVPALDLWDIVIEVLRSANNTGQPKHNSIQETGATLHSKTKTQHVKRRQKSKQLNDVDYVPTNTHSSQGESQLYIFEDNEAVIIMIIKGRSPTTRHAKELLLMGCSTGCCRTRMPANSDSEIFQDHQRYKDFISDIHFSPNATSARPIKRS